ncbi:hypothetical protein CQA53_05605 [Helicobacter didelphidarum]|uniref:TrbI/VirB10 family protein n=2 Tax=Helicobacter didelphidarum TaxID=2040648 RepID=A0A3D8IKV8_9HELI|nr:hypothetical protein CQA53_05605 [Helicobacter didelphidarum]
MKIVGYDSYGNPIYQDSYGNLYDSKGSKINKTLKQFMQEEKERLQKERLKLEHERKKQEQERLRKERLQKEQQEKANANKVISTQSSKNAQSKGTPKKNTNTKANSFSQGNKNGTQRELSPEEREALFQTSQRKRNPLLDEYGISEEEFHLYYNINEDEYYYLMNETGQDSYNSNTKKHSANFFRDSILGQRSTIQTKDADDTKFGDSHFSNQENIDEATNEHKLYRTILAGKLIPAILLTPISSEIEGLVQAQIEQDIYANMGRAVLIPRGSKVLGFYKNDNDVGQSRLQITWREIITPQGVNILLTNAVANDSEGYAGAKGHLNNKYWEKYGMGITLQTLANALTFSISNLTQQPNAGITSQYYAGQILSQSQNDINSVLKQIIAKQSQIKPVITIKAGSRIYITPTAHIWFPIPKNNETMAKYYEEEE